MRLPLATTLKSRNGLVTKDAVIINAVVESNPISGESEVYKRPGNQDLGLIRVGKAQLLYYWNGIKAIIGDFLATSIPGSITLITTWNPSDKSSSITLSGGNLITACAYPGGFVRSSLGTSADWFWEVNVTAGTTSFGSYNFAFGLVDLASSASTRPDLLTNCILYYVSAGAASLIKNGVTIVSGVTAVGIPSTLGIYLSAGVARFYVNGASIGVIPSVVIPTGGFYAMVGSVNNISSNTTLTANFGATAFTYPPSGTFNNLSPTIAGLPFSAQDNGSNSATAYLMFKNASQAWTLTNASGATPVQIVDPNYPGTYTVTLTSLTRVGTVATAATVVNTNFQVGSTVTIAGATPSAYNGAQLITGITASIIIKDGSFLTVTIARVLTTATATSFKPHGLTTGQTVQVAGCDQVEYNGTFTITVLTLTTFTYAVVVTSTTGGIVTSPMTCTLTRSGSIVSAKTLVAHGLSTGSAITIAGANETAYNGNYVATVINQFTLNYPVTVTGPGTTYSNPITNVSVTLARNGFIVTATSAAPHGLPVGVYGYYVTISGVTVTTFISNSFNSTFAVTVISTTQFTFGLNYFVAESPGTAPNVSSVARIPSGVTMPIASLGGNVKRISYLASNIYPGTLTNGDSLLVYNVAGAQLAFYGLETNSGGATSETVVVSNVTGTTFDATFTTNVCNNAYSIQAIRPPISVSTGVRTAGSALVTLVTSAAHNLTTGDYCGMLVSGIVDHGVNAYTYYAQTIVTVINSTTLTYNVTNFTLADPPAPTGTILANSLGLPNFSLTNPATPATGAITLTSSGLTTSSPATPATGTISAKSIGSVTPGSFAFAIAGSPATPATGTITAAGGRNTVPGIVYINGYFCVMDVFGVIYNSALDDPTQYNALAYTTAQAETGAGMCIARSQSYVVAFKEWSTEFFYDAANPVGSPLSPVSNGFIKIGCASGFSVAELEDELIWMSQTRQKGRGIYAMRGTMQQKISTEDIERVLNKDNLSEVFAYAIKINGHGLYILTLVNTNITLVYDITSQSWTQWSSLTVNTAQSIASITQVGGLATVTFAAAHNIADGDPVIISGASQSDYNGIFQTSLISPTTLTINVNTTAVTPATGTILGAGYTESYFKFTKFANALGQYLILHNTDGHLYQIKPELNFDSGIPINTFFRTIRLDGGDLDTQKIMYKVVVVGDTISDIIMLRQSDDDSVSFSVYRPVDLSEPNPSVRRMGGYRRRTLELKHNTNNAIKLTALEIQSGV